MIDLEKLGAFYLGRGHDLEKGETGEVPVMYDARDLTTHAVCVGMTGSGKTGLCVDLLEEAALDSVPAIIIDPKGDMTNLLLTFPELRPEDFRPWVNVDDARRKGLSVEEYAEKIAGTWRDGLAGWDQGSDRIRRLKESAEFTIYTPGSNAGIPVSILSSLAAPAVAWEDDEEGLREKVQGTVSALLGLVGIEADPVKSREHILLSNVFEHAWRDGEDLDLAKVIGYVQKPPMRKLGVFDLDTFFPEKDRFELAMALNNLIAAPGFERWLEGQPLDVGRVLHAPGGKPRMSIFYIAHLSDQERMFFVTLLLEQILTWMRAQPGTTSLRALVYFDEVFGYFPPVAEPPSKRPLLTLLKQARAFGLGMMLTTQNPVDLDYKGLTNAGTWFIGKLQTDRDKMRVLEGLESVVSEAGTLLDRKVLDKLISSLDSRVFLLHNVHEERPITFYTRWAMSYLRGPLTRQQVDDLMGDRRPDQGPGAVPAGAPSGRTAAAPKPAPSAMTDGPPTLPPDLEQAILPTRVPAEQAIRTLEEREGTLEVTAREILYEPMLLGVAEVRFESRKYDVHDDRDVALLTTVPESSGGADWEEAEPITVSQRDLPDRPSGDARFGEVPSSASTAKKLKRFSKSFSEHLYRHQAITIERNPVVKLHSEPGETADAFRIRCREAAREIRDEQIDKLSDKYEKKLDRVRDKLAKKERDLVEDEAEYEARKREEILSAGESVLGVFLGHRSSRAVSTAARKRRMTAKAKADIAETRAMISEIREDLAELEEEFREEADEIGREWEEALDEVEEIRITPRRADIGVELFALAWAPHWRIAYTAGDREHVRTVPAYPED
jgi:hypothetical protein